MGIVTGQATPLFVSASFRGLFCLFLGVDFCLWQGSKWLFGKMAQAVVLTFSLLRHSVSWNPSLLASLPLWPRSKPLFSLSSCPCFSLSAFCGFRTF